MSAADAASQEDAAPLAGTRQHGCVQVYTGEGKGKTTAAFGLALRASGHGKRVYIGQFMKGRASGEVAAVSGNRLIHVEQYGEATCGPPWHAPDGHASGPQSGLSRAREALCSGEYDVVVLDEIDVAIWYGLLTQRECLALVDERPGHIDLVLTGRWAPPALIERADLVTEMREVKHYYRQGARARAGIEY
ncbi:MAG: cob(I)yrinic acid a,c-diamide adenosyltransferase [Thermoleophilia bacterium]